MTKKGVGKSKKEEALEAGKEAAALALENGEIEDCDLVMVHATEGYEDYEKLLEGVREKTGEAPVVGTLAGGIITDDGADENKERVGVLVIKSDKIKFTPVFAENLKDNSEEAGKSIAEQLKEVWPNDAKFLLTFPGGLTVNPDALFRGLENNLPESIPFVGGTSGGTAKLERTSQFFNGSVFSDSVVCVLISGDIDFETAVSHGSTPTELKRTVTRAEGNIIYEFNHEPAFQIYKDFIPGVDRLDLLAQGSVCLGTEMPEELKEEYEDILLRIPLSILDNDALLMAAEWPEGTQVTICERDRTKIIESSSGAARKLKEKMKREPELILNFECLGRGASLLEKDVPQKILRAYRQNLSYDLPWFGWFTYGEIAPIGDKNEFHNWTGILLAIY